MERILEVSKFIFDDNDYNIIEKLLIDKEYSQLVSLLEEEKEITHILYSFNRDNLEFDAKLKALYTIDNLVLELYLGKKINENYD